MEPLSALQRYFALPHFRAGQAEAINHLIARRDTLVVMPTGSGKSLIYQLAALLLPDVTLVVSPLVALMKDQADSLTRRNIPATFINSSLEAAEQARRMRAFARREYKIMLVAPERFRSLAFREILSRVPISLLAVDEAHCLSQWGHDFRPDYLQIAAMRGEFKPQVTLALTATATARVQSDIIKLLGLSHAEKLVMGFNRPNLSFEVVSAQGKNDKLGFIRQFLGQARGAGIIYTGSRKDAEEIAAYAREVCKIEARHYHGLLDAATRTQVQDAFVAGDLPLVVATNAFGMGIDRPDVRFVLHYAMPGTIEAYYQEAGRAGRDGLPARAVLLYSPRDKALQEYFIENNSPSPEDLRAVHDFLERSAAPTSDARVGVRAVTFSWAEVEDATGLPPTTARVVLELLETAKALQRGAGEIRGAMNAVVLELSEAALKETVRQVAARREYKYKLLDLMVSYAETRACRRLAMLDYFGDHGEADALVCCDNCHTRGRTVVRAEMPLVGKSTGEAQRQPARAEPVEIDGSVRVTGAMFQQGRAPEEIAAERGLKLSTIYSHLAKLIGEGQVEVGRLIPLPVQQRIRQAIEKVGSVERLTPIKECLPPEIGYEQIRYVVAAWKRECLSKPQLPTVGLASNPRELILATVRALPGRLPRSGIAKLLAGSDSERIAEFRAHPLYNRLSGRTVKEVLAQVDELLVQGVLAKGEHGYIVLGKGGLGSVFAPSRELTGAERATHVHQLGTTGPSSAVSELIEALSDSDANVRRLAASALGKLSAGRAVQPLIALLAHEPGPQVRQYAIKALGSIGDPRAQAALEKILSTPDEMHYNHQAASAALAQLRRS